ncbi:PAS domain-containing protein [Phreatobacter sp.]|uniref:PAS domain-containing protein n=1 Tax=Phreatobacter sp. TaxID=1966341 RepID=UPI0022BFD772|nr:PAS domain-containing protein [Phreatobacter sp.]MCZ8314826.1 PAS domain-containing protein [Phreatobacter sp.]
MTHAAGTTLFAYWDSLRGGRPAPERSDIDPRAIGSILGDTFVLEGDLTGTLPYRLAGSRICSLFAREMKGEGFTEHFTGTGREAFLRGLSDALAAQAGLSLAVTGTSSAGRNVDLEMTLLPLVHRGRLGARMIGTIAGTDLPWWVGRDGLTRLEIGAVSLLWPTARGATTLAADATIQPRSHAFAAKPALRLIQGGVAS